VYGEPGLDQGPGDANEVESVDGLPLLIAFPFIGPNCECLSFSPLIERNDRSFLTPVDGLLRSLVGD